MSVHINHLSPCSVCGAERTAALAARGPVCGDPACRKTAAQRQKAAKKRVFDVACAEIAATTGTVTDVSVPVPYLDRKVVDTPDASKRAFRETLRKEIRDAVAAKSKGATDVPSYATNTAPDVLNASCIACRGRCCRLGGTHAFLDLENMQMLLAQRPSDSPVAVYRDYVRRLPDQSMDQACVYQGEHGCALPGHMRSGVCHSFECDERMALKDALAGRDDASALIVAMEGEAVKAAVIAKPDDEFEWLPLPRT